MKRRRGDRLLLIQTMLEPPSIPRRHVNGSRWNKEGADPIGIHACPGISPGTWTEDYGSWHLGGLVKVVVQGGSKFKVRRKIAELAEKGESSRFSDRGIEGGLLLVYFRPIFTRHYRAAFRLIR